MNYCDTNPVALGGKLVNLVAKLMQSEYKALANLIRYQNINHVHTSQESLSFSMKLVETSSSFLQNHSNNKSAN